jgi:hypothetical protein
MRNVSNKSCGESQKTHFTSNNVFLGGKNVEKEIIWKNIVQPDRPQGTIWRMCIGSWIPKDTYTHSEHVTLFAFPLQQWQHERASMLRYAHTACLVTGDELYKFIHSTDLYIEKIRNQFKKT